MAKPTINNTKFVSIAAFRDPEITGMQFMASARHFGVPLTTVQWQHAWHSGFVNKIENMLSVMRQLKEAGTEYVFALDFADSIFTASAEQIIEKFDQHYNDKVWVAADTGVHWLDIPVHVHCSISDEFTAPFLPTATWHPSKPYLRWYPDTDITEPSWICTCHLAGQIDRLIEYYVRCIEVRYLKPLPYNCEQCERGWRHGDQIVTQIMHTYYPNIMHIDIQKLLFSVTTHYLLEDSGFKTQCINDLRHRGAPPREEAGDALILHSSYFKQGRQLGSRFMNNGFC